MFSNRITKIIVSLLLELLIFSAATDAATTTTYSGGTTTTYSGGTTTTYSGGTTTTYSGGKTTTYSGGTTTTYSGGKTITYSGVTTTYSGGKTITYSGTSSSGIAEQGKNVTINANTSEMSIPVAILTENTVTATPSKKSAGFEVVLAIMILSVLRFTLKRR